MNNVLTAKPVVPLELPKKFTKLLILVPPIPSHTLPLQLLGIRIFLCKALKFLIEENIPMEGIKSYWQPACFLYLPFLH